MTINWFSVFKELETILQPTLIVQGQQDILVPVINATRMAEHLLNVKLEVFQNAGHAAFFQDSERFADLAFKFLTQ